MNKELKQKIEEAANNIADSEYYSDGSYSTGLFEGFFDGAEYLYNEGYRFTREDLRQAFECGADHHRYYDENSFEEWFNDKEREK